MYTKIIVTNMPMKIEDCPFSNDVQHTNDGRPFDICRNDGNKCDLQGAPGCRYSCRWLADYGPMYDLYKVT